jgi:hypothetical protein
MAKATRSLPRNNPSFYIASGAVTLALYRARQAIKDAIRRKGEKISANSSCEITTMAKVSDPRHIKRSCRRGSGSGRLSS